MNNQLISPRDYFGNTLVTLAKKNQAIVVLTADLVDSTRVKSFKKTFPRRFVECGVAEQNMMGVAAGLALSGKIPFVNSFAVFSPGRNWEQLKVAVCYQNTNVKVIGHYAGFGNGRDGATHQAFEDLSLTRCLPNLTVISPCDAFETQKAVKAIVDHLGPVYLRLSRNKSPILTQKNQDFKIGRADILKKGKDVTVVGTGPILFEALKARDILKNDQIEAEIINCHTIKPLDTKTILKSVQKTHCLVTVEEHQVHGGLGSAIVESLAQEYAAPLTEMVGIKDQFGQSGKPEELIKKYQLDADSIVGKIKKVINRRKRL